MLKPTGTNTSTRTRMLLAAAGLLTGTLALAGCTNPEPAPSTSSSTPASPEASPSAEPTPEETPAPENEEEAKAAGEETALRFVETLNAIYLDQGADVERIDAVATGKAIDSVREGATRLTESGNTVEGGLTLTVQSSFAIDLFTDEASVPFGQATVTGCYDTTTRTITQADGSPTPENPTPKTVSDFFVVYDTSSSRWLVQDIVPTGETC